MRGLENNSMLVRPSSQQGHEKRQERISHSMRCGSVVSQQGTASRLEQGLFVLSCVCKIFMYKYMLMSVRNVEALNLNPSLQHATGGCGGA